MHPYLNPLDLHAKYQTSHFLEIPALELPAACEMAHVARNSLGIICSLAVTRQCACWTGSVFYI